MSGLGIYKASELSNEAYHAMQGISKSGLDDIARSPAYYKYRKPREATRNMQLGTAMHAAYLEPEMYKDTYIILDGIKARTAPEYKKAVAVHTSEKVLVEHEAEKVNGMARALLSNHHSEAIRAAGGDAELSIVTTDPVTGVIVRCRFDYLTTENIAIDLKKTQSIDDFAISRSINNYRYHVQAAFYSDVFEWATGEKLERFNFHFVEEDAPHMNVIKWLDDDSLALGRYLYRRDLNTYAECLSTDKWPGIVMPPSMISVPEYAFDEDGFGIEDFDFEG